MNTEVVIFPWDRNFETGIEIVDEQHKELVGLLNKLVSHLAFQSDGPTIDAIFSQLKDYVEFHFSTEEQVWSEHFEGDTWQKWHVHAHADFVNEVIRLKEEGESSSKPYDEVLSEIVRFLTHWLSHHILESDKRMAKVVLALPTGVSLSRAKEMANEEMSGATRVLIDTIMGMYDKLANSTVQMSREIYKRQQAEKDLEISMQRAEQANQAKSVFLANMSHELRTPLNVILGFSEMMGRDPKASPDQLKKLSMINSSGEHLQRMINEVLDLSKIEAGQMALEMESFNLESMLEEIGRIFAARAASVELAFGLDIAPDLAKYIESDALKLRQILFNLLDNAIKFTRKGGITLRARSMPVAGDNGSAVIQLEVEDTGPGIPVEQLERVFSPFVQVGGSPNTNKGTGLGLTITRSFLMLMGGDVRVESRPGEGALFKIEFPAGLAREEDVRRVFIHQQAVVGLEPGQPAWRILVVEDNLESRVLLVSMLSDVGFEVREAENGESAVEQFREWQPHLVWMDMHMPVMDGVEATRHIRDLPGGKNARLLAITASVFEDQRVRIMEAGCDGVVYKPFKAHEIFDAMAEHLDVRYIHASDEQAESDGSDYTVSPAELETLPATVRQALSDSIVNLSVDKVNTAIQEVHSLDPGLAGRLQSLADNLQYSEILKLLNRAD
ncbi:MAG: bacteriohemerythrin [Sedimenticola sp.]